MMVPDKITKKVERLEALNKEADAIYDELLEYFDNHGMDGVSSGSFSIAEEPSGILQNENEYCDQIQIGEDWYEGTYYYPTKDGRYIAISYTT